MSRTIWVGAVAYDPKVVTIWEGMRRYFHEEAHLPVEVVLFQSYEAQVAALLVNPGDPAPMIDIGWNTNLAFLQATEWSGGQCAAIAMRDTDLGWMTKIVAAAEGPLKTLADLKGKVLALGSRDSGHAAILPVHFLEAEGLIEGKTYRSLRFNSDLGKHGDTGRSEVDAMRAVLDGRADAAAVGSPFWDRVTAKRLTPQGALVEIWTSEPFNHCMFTSRPGFDPQLSRRFAQALEGMSYDNPAYRPVLEAEGLKSWVKPQLDGYASLRAAAGRQGFFERQPL